MKKILDHAQNNGGLPGSDGNLNHSDGHGKKKASASKQKAQPLRTR
jgi:hypothetical protein